MTTHHDEHCHEHQGEHCHEHDGNHCHEHGTGHCHAQRIWVAESGGYLFGSGWHHGVAGPGG